MRLITILQTFLVLMFVTPYTFGAPKVNTIKISGNVKFPDNRFTMQIVKREGFNKIIIDSCKVDKYGNYHFTMNVKEPGVYTLDCQKWQSVPFWAEDENLKIDFRGQDTARIKIKNPPYVVINGGEKNELMNLLNWDNYRAYQLLIGISQGVYRIPDISDEVRQKTSSNFYDMLNTESRERTKYLIERYGHLKSVIALLENLNDDDLVESTITKLKKLYPNYAPLDKLITVRKEEKAFEEKMRVGNIAPNFSYPSLDSSIVYGPQNFRGKYMVIDFWASWCGPCRGEIPNLKALYQQVENTNEVVFLSVSIDKSEADWKKALKEEQMPWYQVLAPNAGSEIMKEYQFSGIPFIIILDKEGKIVAKNLRGSQITDTLTSLLDNTISSKNNNTAKSSLKMFAM